MIQHGVLWGDRKMEDVTFIEDWRAAVDAKNSVLCLGLDPAVYWMGRGEKGLPQDADKREWSLRYIEAAAPFAAGLKFNAQYFKAAGNWGESKGLIENALDRGASVDDIKGLLDQVRQGDMENLEEIVDLAQSLGLVVIEDGKFADIGPSNDAALYHSACKLVDAVTIAPYAGNMEATTKQAHGRGLGVITMCLMSSNEFEDVKNETVPIKNRHYDSADIFEVAGAPTVRKYVQLAHDAASFGVDGIVIGAPRLMDEGLGSRRLHPTPEEIEKVQRYSREDTLALQPGFGAQGGDPGIIFRYFGAHNVIGAISRVGMFPNGSRSTSAEHAQKAMKHRDMLNMYRHSA
jgi:orotidine-5'-phosphate decarboxylase